MPEEPGFPSESFFLQKCREHGLRATPQRLAIFRLVQKAEDHPNADVIFRKVRRRHPNLSFDTVNRTLLSFAQIGVLKVVEGYGYPKRFDPQLKNHHHFHCVQCNRIYDFPGGDRDTIRIPRQISREHHILHQKIVLEGICSSCRK